MNTIKEEFKEPHLIDVQRGWIRKPFTIAGFILVVFWLILSIFSTALWEALLDCSHDIKHMWNYAKQCWKGERD